MADYSNFLVKLQQLNDKFDNNFAQYKQPGYNETEVRVDFVNYLFECLGWDIFNKKSLPQHLREVKHEADVMVEENGRRRRKKPDYSFRAGTETRFYLETKKPNVDILATNESAFQVRRYGWNGNLKISVLTNYTDLLIYDCSIRPKEDDDMKVALLAHFHYTEYVTKFDEIYHMLSIESVLSGEFDRKFTHIGDAFQKEAFDEYFLGQIRNWRMMLGTDIVKYNQIVNNEDLNVIIQRILNRIIFLRICEDRAFEVYESLKPIKTYQQLKSKFKSADQKYNSGLFDLIDDEKIVISDEVIIAIFKDLYYPNSSYEFSVVDPYIIGQIYELFLAEAITVQLDGSIIVSQKPEIVDSSGAVNTPKNITDIITQETLDPLYFDKELSEVKDYRIADICCGSGNFLLSAYEYIVNFYIEVLHHNNYQKAIQRGDLFASANGENLSLSYALKRNILMHNIWGVDIDPLAVEVTKFSLLMKLLEDSFQEEVAAYHKEHGHILPNLDSNIKNGNSLVDSIFSSYDPAIFSKPELMMQIKMFDWKNEFGNQGFDAIIGNPPYIRVQNMVHYSPEEYQFYKSTFSNLATASADTLDKYYLFIERGLSLLKQHGQLGYIIPSRFMNIKSGALLRKLLAEKACVRRIYHFGTQQVFKGRSTYTCILILSQQMHTFFEIAFVSDLERYLCQHTASAETYDVKYLSSTPWTFFSKKLQKILDATSSHCVCLNTLTGIFVGLQTSNDDVYVIAQENEDIHYVYFKDKEGHRQKVEKGLLKPCIYDMALKKHYTVFANRQIIFPYHYVNGKPKIYTDSEMQTQFPYGYAYLCCYKSELDCRKMTRHGDTDWFAFGRSQSLKRFSSDQTDHLIWSVLSTESNYTFDDAGIAFTGGGNGPFYGLQMKDGTQESIFYIQAVLNYWLIERLVKSRASTFRGDYYSHGKQFIETLPIYKIDFANHDEHEKHDMIVKITKTMMQLAQRRNAAATKTQQDTFARALYAEEEKVREILNSLYMVHMEEAGEKVESD